MLKKSSMKTSQLTPSCRARLAAGGTAWRERARRRPAAADAAAHHLGEVVDGHHLAVDLEGEVLGAQAVDAGALLVGDHHLDVDDAHVERFAEDAGAGVLRCRRRRAQRRRREWRGRCR
jgi:hypothetical protein